MKIPKQKTINQLKKELVKTQRIFNEYIRERDLAHSVSGERIATCISCGKMWVLETKEDKQNYHAGHYWRADEYHSVMFDERNVNGQCRHCNRFKHGSLAEYEERLIEKISQEQFDKLKIKKNTTKKYDILELRKLQEIYKQKLKELR